MKNIISLQFVLLLSWLDNGIDKDICSGKRATVQDHYFQISM